MDASVLSPSAPSLDLPENNIHKTGPPLIAIPSLSHTIAKTKDLKCHSSPRIMNCSAYDILQPETDAVRVCFNSIPFYIWWGLLRVMMGNVDHQSWQRINLPTLWCHGPSDSWRWFLWPLGAFSSLLPFSSQRPHMMPGYPSHPVPVCPCLLNYLLQMRTRYSSHRITTDQLSNFYSLQLPHLPILRIKPVTCSNKGPSRSKAL